MSVLVPLTVSMAEEPTGLGSLLVGGSFTALGTPHLGLLDPSSGGPQGSPLAVDGVTTLARSGSHLYLGGHFTGLGGLPHRGLARINAQGQVDAGWHADVTGEVLAMTIHGDFLYLGGRFTDLAGQARGNLAQIDLRAGSLTPWKADADGPVQALVVTEGGLLAGGSFLTINGEDQVRMARLDLEKGQPDPGFTAAADAEVRAFAPVGARVVVGGLFSRIGSQDRHGLVLLDAKSGAVDPTWRPEVNGVVMALAANPSRVVVGGAFEHVNGMSRANGAVISLKDGSIAEGRLETDGPILSLAMDAAGRCHVAGEFTTLNDQTTGPVGRLDLGTGIVDAAWKPGFTSGRATAILCEPQRISVGLSRIFGPARPGLATLDLAGLVTGWRPVLHGAYPRILAGVAYGPHLYLGGDFTGMGNAPHHHLIRVHRLHGELDERWRGDANGAVASLAIDGDQLVIGGDFTQVRGESAPYLARMSLSQGTMVPVAAPDGSVHAILPTPAGLMIAGAFRSVGGAKAVGLACLTAAGTLRPGTRLDLAEGTGPGLGYALALVDAGTVAVGGAFASIGETPAGNLAMVDLTAGAPARGLTTNGPVHSLLTVDGDLLVGGGFTTINDTPRSRLARLSPDGRVSPWRAEANLEVRTLARQGEHLWIGGDFTRLADQQARRLGRVLVASGQAVPTLGSDDRITCLVPLPAMTP